MLYILISLAAFIALLPLMYMLSTSLKTYGQTITRVSSSPFHPNFWPPLNALQFQNYQIAWNEGIGRYFINSSIVSSVTVIGVLLTSVPAAYAFSKIPFKGKNVLFIVLLTTLMIPETVLTIPNFLTIRNLGWFNTLPALTAPFMGSAFFIFLLRQFFNQLPNSFLESARIDGAGTFRTMIFIALPLIRAPLFTTIFLSFTGAWNALQWPLVITNSDTWRPLTVGLLKFLSEAAAESHLRMAASSIALIPVILVYIVAQRHITEAITYSGIKG